MSAESASLKIGYTTLKVRNLPSFLYGFKQTDFSRCVSPIFLTLISQGGNHGIAKGDEQKMKYVFEKFVFYGFAINKSTNDFVKIVDNHKDL